MVLFDFNSRRCPLPVIGMLALMAFGCDQVTEMARDVQSKVMEEDPAAVEETPTEDLPAPSVVDTPPKPQQLPTADELVAEFQGLKPHEISDAAVVRVTSQPEAAAAITALDIKSRDFTAAGVNSLILMKNLESLTLSALMVESSGLRGLSKIPSLKQLDLTASQTDDSVVQSLAELPQLESLNLSGTKITPACASSLAQIKTLRDINLDSTQADDTVVAGLSGLPVRHLQLAKTRVTSAAMATILEMRELEELNLSLTAVVGAAYTGISRSKIRVLHVSDTSFGIEGFMAIKGMKNLEVLGVFKAGLVEHKNVNVFRTMPNLKVLNAGANSITDAGMDVFFKGHRSLEQLLLAHNKLITNNGLAALVGVKTLKQLDVTGTLVDAAGATALKQKLPNCEILTSGGRY